MKDIDTSHLSKDQLAILRDKGTERPYSGALLENKESGDYACAACGNLLFASDTKFESGSGWPAFTDVASNTSVVLTPDHSHGMVRTSVDCAQCGGHLGHFFADGMSQREKPQYCINSLSLDFKKDD